MQSSSNTESLNNAMLIERCVVIGLFGSLVLGVAQVLRPLTTGILFGTILVLATWPFRQWMVQKGLSRGFAASLLLVAAIACVAVPIILIAPRLSERFIDGAQRVQTFASNAYAPPDWLTRFPVFNEKLNQLWSHLNRGELAEFLSTYRAQAAKLVVDFGRALADSMLQLLIALGIATMLWARGNTLAMTIRDVSERLGGPFGVMLLNAAADAARGVAYSVVGTAVVQAAAMTLGLFIAGVPGASLLGFLSLLIAISQIGILLTVIWGGAAWWLFNTGDHGWSLFIIVWGILVSTVDNFIRPWLVSFGATMPLTLVTLGVFGGFAAFGFLGLFIGPTLLAIMFALLNAWRTAPNKALAIEQPRNLASTARS